MQKTFQLQKLNSGGFARIYLDNDDSNCILKINKKGIDKQDQIDTLRNEIAIYEHLKKKQMQNIVKYINYKETDSIIQLRLEKCDCDLSSFQKVSSLSIYDIIYILFNLANVFKELHSANVVHCDVKPSNILLKFNGSRYFNIYLCDFGLSQMGQTQLQQIKGTDYFIDPLMVWYGTVDYSSDLWSLGICMLYILFDKNGFIFNEKQNRIIIKKRSFKILAVECLKKIRQDPNKHQEIQKEIDYILEGIQNETIKQLLIPLLRTNVKDRITASQYLDFMKQFIQQNDIKFPKEIIFNPNIQFITYMKQVNGLDIYVINQEQLIFRATYKPVGSQKDPFQDTPEYLVVTKSGDLFFQTNIMEHNKELIKKYIQILKFPNKCKTNYVNFPEISLLLNVQLNIQDVIIDSFLGLLTNKQQIQANSQNKKINESSGNDGPKEQEPVSRYLFMIQIQEKRSYYIQLNDKKKQIGNADDLNECFIFCNIKNMRIVTKFKNFSLNENNRQIVTMLKTFYEEIFIQI